MKNKKSEKYPLIYALSSKLNQVTDMNKATKNEDKKPASQQVFLFSVIACKAIRYKYNRLLRSSQ